MHLGVNTSTQFSTVYISQHILHKIVTVSMHLGVNTSTQLSTVHDISENISKHTLHEIVIVPMHLGVNTLTQLSTVHDRIKIYLNIRRVFKKYADRCCHSLSF